MFEYLLDDARWSRGIAEIGWNDERPSAGVLDLRGEGLQLCFTPGGHRDRRALRSKASRDCPANAAAGPGDQSDAALQFSLGHRFTH